MRAGPRWRALVGAALGTLLGVGVDVASAAARPGAPHTFEARVSHVSDGDTVWVVPEPTAAPVPDAPVPDAPVPDAPPRHRKPLKLRLVGIDAPERCQAHGEAATRALSAQVLGQRVTVRRRATDDYGRALGTLSLDGEDVAARLVRDGHAWSARRFDRPGPYAGEEQSARAARRGLFALRNPQHPRDFRREHGPCRAPAAADRSSQEAAPRARRRRAPPQ